MLEVKRLQCCRSTSKQARPLSDWLRRCRATVGEVRGATFVRLMESLVESVLLYGAARGMGWCSATWAT